MGVLSNLEPKKVFYYFEEITKIPHGSGNVEQISNFLVDFAKALGTEAYVNGSEWGEMENEDIVPVVK